MQQQVSLYIVIVLVLLGLAQFVVASEAVELAIEWGKIVFEFGVSPKVAVAVVVAVIVFAMGVFEQEEIEGVAAVPLSKAQGLIETRSYYFRYHSNLIELGLQYLHLEYKVVG